LENRPFEIPIIGIDNIKNRLHSAKFALVGGQKSFLILTKKSFFTKNEPIKGLLKACPWFI
jgi:hypothetical protein